MQQEYLQQLQQDQQYAGHMQDHAAEFGEGDFVSDGDAADQEFAVGAEQDGLYEEAGDMEQQQEEDEYNVTEA